MATWSSGYNIELGYTYNAFRELAPEWLNFVAVQKGVAPPGREWRYLELGCGQGIGLLLLAALNPANEFLGIDFNPQHIAHARALAADAQLNNVRFEEADFCALAKNWPVTNGQFDYVVAHGVYAWLHGAVRDAFTQVLAHATRPGALVFVSYNAMPGCSSIAALQHLLRLWQTSEALPGVQAMERGLERMQALNDAQARMLTALPDINTRLNKLGTGELPYLVQEYLHDNWHPQWFDAVVKDLATAKLNFVGSADICDHYLSAFMPTPQRELLKTFSDPVVKEVMQDVIIHRNFRRDVFSRGAPPLSRARQQRLLLETRLVLSNPQPVGELKFAITGFAFEGRRDIYVPLYEAFANKGPQTIAELRQLPDVGVRTFTETLSNLTMMMHASHIAIHSPALDSAPAKRLNAVLATAALDGASYQFLALPALGQFVKATDTNMILLALTVQKPEQTATELAKGLTEALQSNQKSLLVEGKPIHDNETFSRQAEILAQQFCETTLPRWKQFGVL
ncbi:MAG: class I SAM-dependent methyltransferase [Rhodoferax sp.]|nr:class I SAM-dependent methyltransferase [Rhodoferax sp.]